MTTTKNWLRDWYWGIRDTILYEVVSLIIRWRGVAFIYYVNPPEWESYINDSE